MTKVDQRFAELRAQNRKALVPFVTAGDPDLDTTVEMIRRFDRLDCAVCEVGIPYSDPIADGPVIQASYTRALEKKIHLKEIFRRLAEVAPEVSIPVVTMVSYAIVFRHGPEQFIQDAVAAGVSGAIIPDLLVEDAAEMVELCKKYDFALIQLVTPTTPDERALSIAETTTGFLYYVSVTGITGERAELPPILAQRLSWLKEHTDLPICVGFGISQPDQVKQVADIADGAIVGSAIVRRLADPDSHSVADDVESYVASMLEGFKTAAK